MRFSHYMAQALYHPDWGYYCQPTNRQGQHGDYLTAPTLHPIFGKTLCRWLSEQLTEHPDWAIYEIGPGNGQLAIDILSHLPEPRPYHLIEPHHAARDLQQQRIQDAFSTQQPPDCHWHETLPRHCQGIILANEILDALPVERFSVDHNGDIFLHHIALNKQGMLCDQMLPIPTNDLDTLTQRNITMHRNTSAEFSTNIPTWLRHIDHSLDQGGLLLLDYGYPRHRYYHPDRHQGTLTTFAKHRQDWHWLHAPGQIDLSCHVDWTLVAESTLHTDFCVRGWYQQGPFFSLLGLGQQLPSQPRHADDLACLQAAQYLTDPREMGELIQLMWLEKNAPPHPLLGMMEQINQLHHLAAPTQHHSSCLPER